MSSPGKILSVITVCKNNALGIRKTLESVLAQKGPSIEYIVLDGGSVDGTADVIREYQGEVDGLVSEKDDGIYSAINKGIRLVTGSLVGLIHSGDTYLPGVLSHVLAHHAESPGSILYGCMKTTRNGQFDQVMGWSHTHLTSKMIPHLASFVPLSVYRQHGLYDERYRIASDYEAFLRYYREGVPFRFLDLVICEFNMEGISERSSLTRVEVRHIKERYGLLPPETTRKRVYRVLKDRVLSRFLRLAGFQPD